MKEAVDVGGGAAGLSQAWERSLAAVGRWLGSFLKQSSRKS
jgi:hypothetical protein